MLTKKSVIVLVIIAVILAGISIATNFSDTKDISTKAPTTGNSIRGGEIGIKILPSPVEDKLASGESS